MGAVFGANAQEDIDLFETLCGDQSTENIADILAGLAEDIRNGEDLNLTLLQVATMVGTIRATCSGYLWTSEEYGNDTVTDPVVFADAAYRLIVEGNTSASVELTVISGKCGDTFAFIPSAGGRSESVSVMESCYAILDLEGDDIWSVLFEPIVTLETTCSRCATSCPPGPVNRSPA
jgi:hypothetical protein